MTVVVGAAEVGGAEEPAGLETTTVESVGAVEESGAEDAAGSEMTTMESVGGADMTGVEPGRVGRTADGQIGSGYEGDSKVSD